MGLIHTPRTIAALARGYWRSFKLPKSSSNVGNSNNSIGIGRENAYLYQSRAGLLWDVDYNGHMNNAAFLTHAELARWELTAINGLLPIMYKQNVNFYVTATAVRYRQQIRPVFRKFQVDTYMAGLESGAFWFVHTFRYPGNNDSRARAHVIAKGVPVQNGKVIDAREFLQDKVGVSEDVLEKITLPNIGDKSIENMMDHFTQLEDALKTVASVDDERQKSK